MPDRNHRYSDVPPAERAGRQSGLSSVALVVITLLVVLLLGGGTAAALYVSGMIGAAPAMAAATEADAEGETGAETPKAPPIYVPMEPPLVVNFDRKAGVGYLQINIELMARDKSLIEAVQEHMPVIRNALILMLSSKSYEELDDRAEKEALRVDAREEINAVLDEQGIDGGIEALYFTGFVMQ